MLLQQLLYNRVLSSSLGFCFQCCLKELKVVDLNFLFSFSIHESCDILLFLKEILRINDVTCLVWKEETTCKVMRGIYFECGSLVILIMVQPLGMKRFHLLCKSPQRHWDLGRSVGKEQPITKVFWLWEHAFFFLQYLLFSESSSRLSSGCWTLFPPQYRLYPWGLGLSASFYFL